MFEIVAIVAVALFAILVIGLLCICAATSAPQIGTPQIGTNEFVDLWLESSACWQRYQWDGRRLKRIESFESQPV